MRRRDFVVLLGSSAVCPLTPPRAFSQQLASIPRVGVLVSASEPHPFADALRRGLEQLGYSDGRNIALDVRYTQGRSDRAAELAADLVRNGVTIIVAHFTPAVRAAIAATKTIPHTSQSRTSLIGTKRKCLARYRMSAFGSKADIVRRP
jgi:putative ABC transport system substrate-binding protein